VVHFLEYGELSVRQAFNEPYLPQWSLAIQVLAVKVCRELDQSVPVAGRGDCYVADMPVNTEVLILHPVGQVQPQGYLVKTPMELGYAADSFAGEIPVFGKTEIGAITGVKQQQAARVLVYVSHFTADENSVLGLELFQLAHIDRYSTAFVVGLSIFVGDRIKLRISINNNDEHKVQCHGL
jgi:hypothetical protein